MMKDGAIIITGQLRSWARTVKNFNNLLDRFDIFVVTDDEWIKEITDDGYIAYSINNYPDEQSRHIFLEKLVPVRGRKMFQWSKLAFGLQKIKEHEIKYHKKYNYFYKMRSDIKNIDDIIFEHQFKPGWIYCESDYCFSADRETFLKLNDFFSNPEKFIDWTSPIDTSLPGFSNSSYAAAKFRCLPYPSILKFFSWRWLQVILRIGIKWPSTSAFSFRKNWENLRFASEAYFLRFILESGFSVTPIGKRPIALFKDRRNVKPLIN